MQYIKKNTYILRKPILKSYHMPLRKQQKNISFGSAPPLLIRGGGRPRARTGGVFSVRKTIPFS